MVLLQSLVRFLLLAMVLSIPAALCSCARKEPPPQSQVIGSRFRDSENAAAGEYPGPAPEYGGAPPSGYAVPPSAPQPAPQVSITPASPARPAAARNNNAPARPLWRRNTYRWVKENESAHAQRNRESAPTDAGRRVFGSGRRGASSRNLPVW